MQFSTVFLLHAPAPTPYSAVFLLHAPAPAPIKIGFGAVQFDAIVSVKLTPIITTILETA